MKMLNLSNGMPADTWLELSPVKQETSLQNEQETQSESMTDCNTSRNDVLENMKTPQNNQCLTCLKCFSAPSKLKRHVLTHTNHRPFGCRFCAKTFRQLPHLKVHLATHLSERTGKMCPAFQYSPCGSSTPPLQENQECGGKQELCLTTEIADNYVYANVYSMEVMDINQSVTENCNGKKRIYDCPICLKRFGAPSKLKRHYLIHTDQRPFPCSICCHAFRQLSNLKVHIRAHTDSKKNTSPFQSYRFNSLPLPTYSVSNSRLKHSTYNCLARTFRSYSPKHLSLQQSNTCSTDKPKSTATDLIKTESDTASITVPKYVSERYLKMIKYPQGYRCPTCSKCFKALSKLKRHILIHTGRKPFKCTVCAKAFQQKAYLKIHKCKAEYRTEHNSSLRDGQYAQNIIKQSPGAPNAAEDVVKTRQQGNATVDKINSIHDVSFFGPEVRFVSSGCSPNAVTAAEKIIPPTSESSKLLCMLRLKKNGGYQCRICLKIFCFPSKLIRHLFIHTDIRPYTCIVCRMTFRQLCHLQRHLRVHMAKRQNPLSLDEDTEKYRTKSPTPGDIADMSESFSGTKNCKQDGGSIPLPQTLDSILNKKYQKLDQIVPSQSLILAEPFESCTAGIESSDALRNDKVQIGTSSPMYVKLQRKGVNRCSICLKNFQFPSKLARHFLSHTGTRQFKCHVCSKSFRQRCHLQCHQSVHKKTGQNVIVGKNLEQQSMVSFGNEEISEDQVFVGAEDFITVQQDQVAEDIRSQKMNHEEFHQSGGCSDSSGTSNLENVEIKSEVIFRCNDKSVCELLIHKTDISMLVEKRTSDIMPFGRVSDCPPTTDSSFHYCASEQRTEEECSRDMDDVIEDCAIVDVHTVKYVPDSYMPRLHQYQLIQPSLVPGLKDDVVQEHLDSQVHTGRFVEPPNDLPICPGCSECFPTLKTLHAHKCAFKYPEETITKSYQCDICFKVFGAPSKLKRHCVIHTGQKPFQCIQCVKSFTQSSNLKRHMLSHS
ncbi:zinc finger protein 770 [Xyrauchen texanus]|uniref:zinc finger protein 770 n=1 Tax=Xyrauchen texanus TaxID=154827 RepID=UPI002242269B|nr:zinc finger protein 770 [Xyrauchen texanus]